MTLIPTRVRPVAPPSPAALLARLGTTPDEVAARLLDLQIQGRPGRLYECPLAAYLASRVVRLARVDGRLVEVTP
jgi:hypothetical protein